MAKKATLNNYVAVICLKGGGATGAVMFEGYQNKQDVMNECRQKYPKWNIKAVHKLYDEDFKE